MTQKTGINQPIWLGSYLVLIYDGIEKTEDNPPPLWSEKVVYPFPDGSPKV